MGRSLFREISRDQELVPLLWTLRAGLQLCILLCTGRVTLGPSFNPPRPVLLVGTCIIKLTPPSHPCIILRVETYHVKLAQCSAESMSLKYLISLFFLDLEVCVCVWVFVSKSCDLSQSQEFAFGFGILFCFESLHSPGSQGAQLAPCRRWVQVTVRPFGQVLEPGGADGLRAVCSCGLKWTLL